MLRLKLLNERSLGVRNGEEYSTESGSEGEGTMGRGGLDEGERER